MSDAESNAAAPPAAEVEQQSPVAQEGTAPTADSPTAAGDDAADVKEQGILNGVGNEKAGDENGDLKLKDEAKDAAQNSADNEAPAAAPAADDKKEDSATQSIVVVPQQATSTTDANGESTPEKTTTTTTPAPQPTTKKSSSSSKRKSLGGNKRKGASRPLHLDAKPGEYYIARLKSYPPWPSVICDEEMLPPALTAKRPVTTKQPDGTYFEAYADGGKRVYERTFPIMFLGSNEFAWIANTDITPITPEECAAAPEKGKTKGLIEAFKIASEGHDLNYFKKVISDHNAALQQEEEALMAREAEKERKAQKKAEKAAAKAANQQKGKRKSTAAAETDDDDGETEQVSEKKKPSKKRKKDAESDVDTEKPAKTPKTSMKLKLTTPKAPGEKEEKSSTGKKATAAATSAKTSKAKGKQAGDKEVAEDATSKEEKKKKEPTVGESKEQIQKRKQLVLYLRHKLQKGFLTRDQAPEESQMATMSQFINRLEAFKDLEVSIIRETKINKVLKGIVKLHAIPKEEEFHFRDRSMALLTLWKQPLADAEAEAEAAKKKNESKEGVKDKKDLHKEDSLPASTPAPPDEEEEKKEEKKADSPDLKEKASSPVTVPEEDEDKKKESAAEASAAADGDIEMVDAPVESEEKKNEPEAETEAEPESGIQDKTGAGGENIGEKSEETKENAKEDNAESEPKTGEEEGKKEE